MSKRKINILFCILLILCSFLSFLSFFQILIAFEVKAQLGLCLMPYIYCYFLYKNLYILIVQAYISSVVVFAGKTQFKVARFFLAAFIQCLLPLGILIHMYFIDSSTWFKLDGILATVYSIALMYFILIITTPYTYIYLLLHYLCTRWVRRLAKQEGGQLW